MNFQEIKGELIKHGSSLSALSRDLGLSQMGVKHVAVRNSVSFPTATAIAKKINKPLLEVFPEYKNHKPRVVKK